MARQVLVARKIVIIAATVLMVTVLLVGAGGLKAVGTSAPAHPFCLADELLRQSLRQDPALKRKMDEQETAIRNYVESRRSKLIQQQSATSNLIIPVVVYVVHNNGPENISDQQVNSQITALNNAFSGQGIQFCLATKEGSTQFTGSTPGIIRIANGLTNHLTSQESQLKALSTLPGDRYLRIWVVKDIDNHSGVAGYARFPGTVPLTLEGIVMRYDVFGDVATCGCSNLLYNYDQGKILAHEVGHYLYLYHAFQGGCTGTLPANCATAGDRVCDTPQIPSADTGCPTLGSVPSCNTGTSALTDNEMDYTTDLCRNAFTVDQETRMLATINTLRPLLVSAQNLVYTGVQCASGLSAAFSADNYNPCTNQTVTFIALNTAGATYAWDFGDGSAGTGNSVTHSYSTAGTYAVTLTVTSGSNTVSSTQQVFVTNCTPISSTQGNWYFGGTAGLNFSTGAPVVDLNSNMSTIEGCVTQSDAAGSLLFYSDSINVYDKNHTLMNPTMPLNGNGSNSQSAISLPDPTGQNRYYLFTLGPNDGGSAKLWYTIVDFASSSTGALTNVNTQVSSAGINLTEQITAVPKCNNSGYWIIVHRYGLSEFLVYSLTSTGITGPSIFSAQPATYGTIKASPDGTMLAQSTLTSSGGPFFASAALYNFDRATGAIGLRAQLAHGSYGCSFSPDSKLLYMGEYPPSFSNPPASIYQYDVADPNPDNSVQLVAQVPAANPVNLQLAPDKKIYATAGNVNGGTGFLQVINYPNNRNTSLSPNACGYDYNGPNLGGRWTKWGLPNMIDALPPSQTPPDFSYIISSCSTVQFSAPACAASYAWDFGDTTTSNVQNPTHTYGANGTYTVSLTLNGATTVNHTLTIGIPPSAATIFGPAAVCVGSGNPPFYNYSANAQPGLVYTWTVTGGAISGVSNSDNVDVVWNNFPGTVQLTVADPTTGCSMTQTLTVNQTSVAGTDLYMKDTMAPDLPEDFGVEPTVSQTLFISRDIWVRTSQDTILASPNPGPDTPLLTDRHYANEHQHQDPTYSATTPSYVYVKVRNRGCTSSTGTEKLRVYWANAGTGLPWPGSTGVWNELDCVAGGGIDPCSLPVIGPGQDYVVELPWMTPDPASFGGSDHFCLVARIETQPSSPFGMTSAEGPVLWQNVAGNNNIAWKNVTVFAGGGHGHVTVGNIFERVTPLTLRFAVPATELKDNFLLHGDIFIDLGDALMKKWLQGGQRPEGFDVVGKTTIRITDPTNAVLGGLLFAPGEKQTIEVRMQLKPGDKARVGGQFNWDVIQMAPRSENAKPSPIGGERYIFVVPNLTMTKTVAPNPALTGQTLTYTVKYTNNGTADAFDVELRDTLPPGLTLGAITASCPVTASSSNTFTVTCAQVPKAPNPGSTVIVTYQALASPATCPVTMDNRANLTWTSLPGPQGTTVNATGSTTPGNSGAVDGERNGVTLPLKLNHYATTASASVKIDCPCKATISGLKFVDLNGSGVRDMGEPGLANWTIKFTDSNGNTQTTTTDSQGNYSITVPAPGTYTVSEVLQSGWTQTAPTTGTYAVTVSPGQVVNNRDFGNMKGNGPGNINVRKGEFTFTRGMNEFCIWGGGGSYSSPTQIDNPYVGTVNNAFRPSNTRGVRFGAIGLCYGRILSANDRFAFKYTFHAIPIAVLSYPDVNPALGFPVPVSETRRNVFGAGLSPIGFQLYFRPQNRVKPFVNTSGGVIFFKDQIPRLNGAQFNFTYDFGGGVQVFRDSRRAFTFGYKYQRISNGGRALNNPGFDGHVFYLGYSIFKAPKNRPEQ